MKSQQNLENLRNIRQNDQKIDRLKAAMKKGANTPEEAAKLMQDIAAASADDKKYHDQNKKLFTPPAKPAAVQTPEPVAPIKPIAPTRETDEQAHIRIAKETGMSPDKIKLDNSSSRPAPGSREAGLTESNFMN
ncbi:hypothetical protein IPF37_06315 [bacterium]|nr:MAG: hypothetical protein IPF37_06315 [bacterium]